MGMVSMGFGRLNWVRRVVIWRGGRTGEVRVWVGVGGYLRGRGGGIG